MLVWSSMGQIILWQLYSAPLLSYLHTQTCRPGRRREWWRPPVAWRRRGRGPNASSPYSYCFHQGNLGLSRLIGPKMDSLSILMSTGLQHAGAPIFDISTRIHKQNFCSITPVVFIIKFCKIDKGDVFFFLSLYVLHLPTTA